MEPSGRQSLRVGRRSLPGHFYHITMVTKGREPLFIKYEKASAACRAFLLPVICRCCTTQAYVVMPDHVHWLLHLHDDLSKTVRLYKSHVSLALGNRIWEDGYHDHGLRQEEDIRRIARYIVANPLRAGLVEDVRLYPYWDAIWLSADNSRLIN